MKLVIILGMMTVGISAQAESYGGKVRLLGGLAPTGVTTNRLNGTGNNIETKLTRDKVYGIGFDINVSPRVSVGVESLTNNTQLLSLGLNI